MSLDDNKARAFVQALLAAAAKDRQLDAHRDAGGHQDDTDMMVRQLAYLVDAAAKALAEAMRAGAK